jgi:CspA family cold shock protein
VVALTLVPKWGVLRVVDPLLELTVRQPYRVQEDVEVTVATGTVKKVVSDRGFGFITADDGKDYFFHRNALTASLDFDRLLGGEKVSFEVEQSPKGPRATNVQSA